MLLIKNAQGFSLGTLFKNYHTHPSYTKSQRKKLYPPKPGSAKFRPLAPGLIVTSSISWSHTQNDPWFRSGVTWCKKLTKCLLEDHWSIRSVLHIVAWLCHNEVTGFREHESKTSLVPHAHCSIMYRLYSWRSTTPPAGDLTTSC